MCGTLLLLTQRLCFELFFSQTTSFRLRYRHLLASIVNDCGTQLFRQVHHLMLRMSSVHLDDCSLQSLVHLSNVKKEQATPLRFQKLLLRFGKLYEYGCPNLTQRVGYNPTSYLENTFSLFTTNSTCTNSRPNLFVAYYFILRQK